MSTISNKFYVQAIDDGSTLHAQLLSDKSLSQGYTSSGCVPNWQTAANQPTVYVDLVNGTDRVSANAGGTWTYNGVAITFNANNVSTDGRFQRLTNYVPTGYSSPVPAMKIIDNLASNTNVNTDTIGYSGSYTLGGNDIGFALTTFVRITGIMANGIFGVIEFVDNSNIISQDGQKKTMRARLYGADGEEIVSSSTSQNVFTTAWTLNDVSIGAGGAVTVDGTTYYQAMQVAEDDSLGAAKQVTDNAIVGCTFTYQTTVDGQTATLTYAAYESIDDQTDPEQMYIQTIVSNGGAGLDGGGAELHKGQSVEFHIWMGTMTDTTIDTSWTNFYARLHKSDGSVNLDTISGLNNVESSTVGNDMYGYRRLDNVTVSDVFQYAKISFPYETVASLFNKYLTGYVKAVKS